MADFAISCHDVIADYFSSASQVRIRRVVLFACSGFGARCSCQVLRAGRGTPNADALPVVRPTIMVVILDLVLARNWLVQIEAGSCASTCFQVKFTHM